MLDNLSAYCINVYENVYAFLYNFLLSYKSYVVINIATVNYYMSKRNLKDSDSLKFTKAKFERKCLAKSTRPRRSQASSSKMPSLNVPRQQTPSAHKSPTPEVVTPRAIKNALKKIADCQKVLTPPRQVPSPYNDQRPPSVDKSDETLDEITWACDDSHSSLDNSDNTKQCQSHDKIKSAKDVRASKSSHVCRRMEKSTDVRDDQQLDEEGNIVKQDNRQKNNRLRCDGKKRQKGEDSKSCVQKKKLGKLKQKVKKVSRGVSTQKHSRSGQQNNTNIEEPCKMACAELPLDINQEMLTHCGEKRRLSVNEARATRIRHKQHTSPRLMETVKNSSGDSKNSMEESDLDMGASDQQFHGNRSESSLVCKRDSWIWFSPEMRSSVEDFAARQRKFRSRDPRVAELAFEISRQEEMNRDIERAAESLIDSSSPSTCKLLDGSLRKSLCGAMKTRASRKSRVAPYNLPDIKKLPISPVSRLAGGDHANKADSECNDRGPAGTSLCSDVMKILPTRTKPDKQTDKIKDSSTSTKRRKTRQKVSNEQTKSGNYKVVCTEPCTPSPATSEHSNHNEAEVNTLEGQSLARAINWYNSPAASVIRRLYTPSRYSPLYDNTTLVSSTQCSLCSLVSNSPENTKVTGNQQKHRAVKSDESNQREGLTVQGRQPSSPVEIKGSPGEINLHLTKYVNDERVTSPTRRQYHQEVTESLVMSKDEVESGPESPNNVQERYTNRLSPKWKSSKSSPRKRRFSDRVVSITNRPTPENRIENYKYARRSPQLTFSTGESESDSVYKDKSAGPDASYRQCMISKEVNTTVQRLLFDTEKSSSSHSPSSRSRVHFPDVNTDEDSNTMLKRDHKNNTDIGRLRESCTRIKISTDSPPQIPETDEGKQDSGSDKHSCGSHDDRLLGVLNPQASFISSDSQTCCNCQKMTQKFTNIYARDYYLGKRVTMKKQMEAKASVHSTKWKKLDITWCTKSPRHSSHNKSRLHSSRRDSCSSARESFKHKPGVKMLSFASRHSHRFQTSVGCQVTQTISSTSENNFVKDNLAVRTEAGCEMSRHACKCSQTQDYKKCNKPKVGFCEPCDKKSTFCEPCDNKSTFCQPCDKKSTFCEPYDKKSTFCEPYDKMSTFCEPCDKMSTFKKSSSQLDNCMLPDSSDVSPSKKPYIPSRSAASVPRCKKVGAVQTEPSTLLAIESTNNSSNNLSYCSDKSTSSEKPSLFSKTAQFYFVTGENPSLENISYQRDSLGNVELSTDASADMFNNSQIPGGLLKLSTSTEPAVNNCYMKGGHDHEAKDTTQTACTINPVMPAFLTCSELENYKTQVTAERCDQRDTNVVDKHQVCPAMRSNIIAQQGMYYCNYNTTMSTNILPCIFTIEGDNPRQDRVMAQEDGYACNCDELKPFDADTADVDLSNFVTPVLTSAVKQSSNPDSGYDESLSEKANGDCNFQASLATAVDLPRTSCSPQWLKQHMCNLEPHDTKSWCTSPVSDISRSSDHAHRSHVSNECDSEQDTLPSLSDDTFQTPCNFNPLNHRSPDTSRCAQNSHSISFTNDITKEDIYQDSLFNTLTNPSFDIVSPQDLNKAIGKTRVDPDWTRRHNIHYETGKTGNPWKIWSDSNQLFPREWNWNGIEETVGVHSAVTTVPPASVENVYIEDCQGVTNEPKMAPDKTMHNTDLSNTANNTDLSNIANNTDLSNIANNTPDHFLAELLNALHSQAMFSETPIVERGPLETFKQANSTPTWSAGRTRRREKEAQLSNTLCKSAGNGELFESKASYLGQSDQVLEHIWSTAAQAEQGFLASLPTFNWQYSKETYLTPRLETPLTTNTVLDWIPLDGSTPAESIISVPGKVLEADQPDKASSPVRKSHVKTIQSPNCLTVCPADIPEGALPQAITVCPADIPEDELPQSITGCTADIPEDELPQFITGCTADIPEAELPQSITVCPADLPEDELPQSITVCTADIPEAELPQSVTVCTADTPEGELPQAITLPPTSSDEEDSAEGEGCYDTLAHTSGSKTNIVDCWTGERGKPASIQNGTCNPAWGCRTDNRDSILTRKLHQNNYKQSANTHLSQQAQNKVFISKRSIAFSEILKRF